MKTYVKPELGCEHFEVCQQIAACGWDLNQADESTCVALQDINLDNQHITGEVLFLEKPRCNVTNPGSYCYTNGAGGDYMRVFQS